MAEINSDYEGLAYVAAVCVAGALETEEIFPTREEAEKRADAIAHDFAEHEPELLWDIFVSEVVVSPGSIEASQYETDHRPYATSRPE